MTPARWWVAIALVAMVAAPPIARAQADGPGEPGLDSWLAEGPGDPGPGMDDEMGLAGPGGMGGAGYGHRMGPRGPWMMGRGRGGMGGFGMPMARLRDLDLTEAQRTKLADIREKHAKTAITGRADVQLAELDLRKLMRAEKPDAAAINRQIDKVSSLRAALEKNRVAGMLEARGVLTPEQLQKLRQPMRMGPKGGPGEPQER